ncbi:MAG: EAL domain-containing protein, partial [Clostridia bacterium]
DEANVCNNFNKNNAGANATEFSKTESSATECATEDSCCCNIKQAQQADNLSEAENAKQVNLADYYNDGKKAEEKAEDLLDELEKAELLSGFNAQPTKKTNDLQKIKIENDLNLVSEDFTRALAENEFTLFYQPKVQLEQGFMVGLEAFIRWKHAKHGIIAPNKFLYLADKFGCMQDIDAWVINKVCADIKTWKNNNLSVLPVSVNFSEDILLNKNFLNLLINTVNKYNLDNNELQIQITEEIFFNNYDYCNKLIKILQENDFVVAIEDLTVKYCNLENLAKVRCNQFTFSREAGIAIVKNEKDRQIASKIIEIAKANNISVLCEGIETGNDVELLKSIGCTYAQGYYFGRPVDSATVSEYMV